MSQQHINYSFPNDGLGDTLREAWVKQEANNTELYNNKVDKVVGKGLSDTNFTQLEKDKLAELDPGFQLPSDWNETDSDSPAFIFNKPENTSSFNNDGDGITPFVLDVTVAGSFVRQNGIWVAIESVYTDGKAGTTPGFTAGQTVFTLPSTNICKSVHVNDAFYSPTTANNTDRVNRWSQSGNVLTIYKALALNNYILIEQ